MATKKQTTKVTKDKVQKAAKAVAEVVEEKVEKIADVVEDKAEKVMDIVEDKVADAVVEAKEVVKKAKTLNSAFGFASTVLLVPLLMYCISKHCEKMTKLRIAEQQKQAQEEATKLQKPDLAMQVLTSKPTMAGFLNRQ